MELMGFFYAFITFSLLFGAPLGFATIFNTASISVVERSREFATLRMIGYTNGEVASSLILENFVLGIVCIVVGISIAYVSAYLFYSFFESELYLPMVVYPRSFAITLIAVFAVIMLAFPLSLRHVSKMDIAKVTKRL